MNIYYIYIYLDPRKHGKYCYGDYCFLYEPFYVGKGKGNRCSIIKCRNKHFINKTNKIKSNELKPLIVKIKENLDEKQSFILESKLIDLIGRKDLGKGPLINFTDGGEGTGGYIFSKETRKLISEKQRKNFSDIQKEFQKRKYKLLTKEKDYKNAHQKLKYMCPEGHIRYIYLCDLKKGYGCSICNSKNKRKNFFYIKEYFSKEDYKLIANKKEYKNKYSKLKYKCPEGHIRFMSWDSFRRGRRCLDCYNEKRSKNQRKKFSDIVMEFNKKGFVLLTKEYEYKNNHHKLYYTHSNGKINSITWNYFQSKYK